MKEKRIEAVLKKQIEIIGGMCLKFSSPGNTSVPDRICLFPGGLALFVECKAPGKVPSKKQEACHVTFKQYGFPVVVVDSVPSVFELCEKIQALIRRPVDSEQMDEEEIAPEEDNGHQTP